MESPRKRKAKRRKPYPVYPDRQQLDRIAALKKEHKVSRLKIRTIATHIGISFLESDPSPLFKKAA